jgi:Zn-dependent M28 family amino/carboxypeptidase
VIAERQGSAAAPRDVVLVTAHLDSINIAGGATASAPGADDNGSGSAGLLAIAQAIEDHPAVHDLRLILFGGEEQGLFGSRQYVASLPQAERHRIRAVVNMDMIGTLNTTSPTVLLEGAEFSQTVIDGLAEAAAIYTTLAVQTSLNPFNSDHVPFIKEGIAAVLTIEGADGANANIHSANDTLQFIDYGLALDILRMNVAFVTQLLGSVDRHAA